MTLYNFLPEPNTPARVVDYATWVGGFTEEELDMIISYGSDNLDISKATLGGTDLDEEYDHIRKSKTGWINLNSDTAWIYDRLAYITRSLNAQNWQFDLNGFNEDLQFTVYDESDSHYTWHVDTIKTGNPGSISQARKLSLVIQLSDPIDYEGGDLEFKTGPNEIKIPKERGLVAAFPSYTLHRVTPVTSGVRKSLVIWISGPPFK